MSLIFGAMFGVLVIIGVGVLLAVLVATTLVRGLLGLFFGRPRVQPRRVAATNVQRAPTRVCSSRACGAVNPDYANFCRRCGHSLISGRRRKVA